MAFPTTLDVLPDATTLHALKQDGTPATGNYTPYHSTILGAGNAAIMALEAKVGVDGSAVRGSLDYLLKNKEVDVSSLATAGAGTLASPYTGWAAAVNSAATNGVAFFFRGWFSAGSTALTFDNLTSVTLRGLDGHLEQSGGFNTPTVGAPTCGIIFTGNANLRCRNTIGFTVEGLQIRNLETSLFTDFVIDASGSDGSQISNVTLGLTLRNVELNAAGGTGSGAPGGCLLLDGVVEAYLDNVVFYGGKYGIQGLRSHLYSTAINVRGGRFHSQTQVPIYNPHMQWAFYDVVFEPMASGRSKWVKADNSGGFGAWVYRLSFNNCFQWDSAGGGDVFDLQIPTYDVSITNCVIDSVSGAVIKPANGVVIRGLTLDANFFGNDSQGAGNGQLFPTGGTWAVHAANISASNRFGTGVDNIAAAVTGGQLADGFVMDSSGSILLPALAGAGTVTSITLTQPAAGLTITNSGVALTTSGTRTFALADDLAALEALSGTNTIYYRSGANTWSAVTVGSGLAFNTGTLTATGGGGGTFTNPGVGANSEGFGLSVATAGINSSAFGNAASAATNNSVAVGASAATTVGAGGTAVGKSAAASNTEGTAVGFSSVASGQYSTAIGTSCQATATNALAVGRYSTASGAGAVAIGPSVTASVAGVVAIGASTTADGTNAIAVGESAVAGGTFANCIAVGAFSTANGGLGCTAVGRSAAATAGAGQIALGYLAAPVSAGELGIGPTTSLANLYTQSSTSAVVETGGLERAAIDNTHATRKYRIRYNSYDTAKREHARGWADGSSGRFAVSAPASAPTDAHIAASQVSFWLNESTNKLTFRVCYADGTTFKTGEVALV